MIRSLFEAFTSVSSLTGQYPVFAV